MDSASTTPPPAKRRRREATVFDAVAGRVNYSSFIPATPVVASTIDTAASSTVAVPPEEVLFRRRHAPTRYEEDDIYFQERHLPPDVKLPDSDLLKAVHGYASHLYGGMDEKRAERRREKGKEVDDGRATGGGGEWESMDETALLAMGILLEEAAGKAMEDDEKYRDFLEEQGKDGLPPDEGLQVWNGKEWVANDLESSDEASSSDEDSAHHLNSETEEAEVSMESTGSEAYVAEESTTESSESESEGESSASNAK